MEQQKQDELEREIHRHHAMGAFEASAVAALRGYGGELLSFLAATHKDDADAAQVFSIFCEEMWRALPGFLWQCSFRTWAYSICRHRSHRYRRDARRRFARGSLLSDNAELSAIEQRLRTGTLPFLRSQVKSRIVELRETLPIEDQARTPDATPSAIDRGRVGTRIGNFFIRAELGRGGMGVVYLGEDSQLQREVALKVLPAFVDDQRRRRFLREARAAARINHSNVVSVFEVGEDAGTTFIAMEYVRGRTLRALLEERGGAALSIPEALRIARVLAELRCEVGRRGGRADDLCGGLFAATFSDPLIATDQAARAARSALALGNIAPSRSIALVMGQTEGAGNEPSAALIDRGRAMLTQRSVRLNCAAGVSIMLDEITAGLLGAPFDVRSGGDGPALASELPASDMTPTLLGKPTPCVGRDRELATLATLFNECVDEPRGRLWRRLAIRMRRGSKSPTHARKSSRPPLRLKMLSSDAAISTTWLKMPHPRTGARVADRPQQRIGGLITAVGPHPTCRTAGQCGFYTRANSACRLCTHKSSRRRLPI